MNLAVATNAPRPYWETYSGPVRPTLARTSANAAETMELHMGPQHPSMHGVLHLIVGLDGEVVRWVDPDIGFVHRGVEKLCETLPWDSIAPVLERNDYLSPTSNSHAYVLAAERLGAVEVPRRGQWLRTLAEEISRIGSHLIAWGTFGMDLGGALGGGTTLFLHCMREREAILDLFQMWTGTRFHINLNQIGGARYDLPVGFEALCLKTLTALEQRIPEIESLVEGHPIFVTRSQGVGVLPQELALALGCSGPTLRASGAACDLRRDKPYDAYQEIPVTVVSRSEGDAYARYRCRIDEVQASIAHVRTLLAGMPEGPIHGRTPVRSAKHKLPAGNLYAAVESPRGELGVWLHSDKSASPLRVRLRSPSFANLASLVHILPGNYVADVVAILGSLDPVFGDVDR